MVVGGLESGSVAAAVALMFGFWCVVFFFSSRRRHTRCSRDWSSDVCSSDLVGAKLQNMSGSAEEVGQQIQRIVESEGLELVHIDYRRQGPQFLLRIDIDKEEIGRASCRERV